MSTNAITNDKPGFTALIVDDGEMSRELAAGILKRLGATSIVKVENGTAALEWADTNDGSLDLVICDLRMPELDGIETLDGLDLRTYPRLFVLASGADPRILRAAGATSAASAHIGADRIRMIAKPLSIDGLQPIIAELTAVKDAAEPNWDLLRTGPADCSTDIVTGLPRGEFIPYFEPKVNVGTRRVVAAEAVWR